MSIKTPAWRASRRARPSTPPSTELDRTAVTFLTEHPCRTVHICNDRPDDIAWFLDAVASQGASDTIQTLHIEMGDVKRVPSELFVAVGRHSGLRTLVIDVRTVQKTCEVFFEKDHHLLRRAISLTSPRETYEDVNMAGATLDTLELDVGVYTDTRRLFRQMSRATIRKLTLHMNDDYFEISRPLSAALEELSISVCVDQADVELDFCCLRDDHPSLKRVDVVIGSPWQHELSAASDHTVTFRHVPTLSGWLAFAAAHLRVHDAARVVVSPT